MLEKHFTVEILFYAGDLQGRPAYVSLQLMMSSVAPGSRTGELDPLEFTGWNFVRVGYALCPEIHQPGCGRVKLGREGGQGVVSTVWGQHKTPEAKVGPGPPPHSGLRFP